MRGLKFVWMAVTLTAAAASAASANMPADPQEDAPEASSDSKGGNAIDKATEAATGLPMTGAGSLPPEGYAIIGDFLASMARGDGWSAAEVVLEAWRQPQDESSSTFGWLAPVDGPAESILDQIDESGTPLPMVGEAGSEVTVAAPQPTPPAESILDSIDQPAPPAAQDAAKPAADQAPRPAVQAPPP